jgi:hypothetical protein
VNAVRTHDFTSIRDHGRGCGPNRRHVHYRNKNTYYDRNSQNKVTKNNNNHQK